MTTADFFVLLKIFFLVSFILWFFETNVGRRVGSFFPAPFWVYFLSILLGSAGFFPSVSPVYNWMSLHGLAAAIFLMLVGTPVEQLWKIGPKAGIAMAMATGSLFVGGLMIYALFIRVLPEGSWKAVGALLGTWIGGSANMIAVKEILKMPDDVMAPLVIADTLLSYSWLALLFLGVAWQNRFDRRGGYLEDPESSVQESSQPVSQVGGIWMLPVLLFGLAVAEIFVWLGTWLNRMLSFLSSGAWVLFAVSTVSVILAMTRLRKLEERGASKLGTYLLYAVLVTIGAKSGIEAVGSAPVYLLFGAALFLFHGAVLFSIGYFFKIPLYLLATASQANIGGPASAPIVASAYKSGAAHLGVLMAIGGAVLGTYIGALGGLLCRYLEQWLR